MLPVSSAACSRRSVELRNSGLQASSDPETRRARKALSAAQACDDHQHGETRASSAWGSSMVDDAGLDPEGTAHGRQAMGGTCDAPVRAPLVRAHMLIHHEEAPSALSSRGGLYVVGDAGLEPATPCL